MRRDMPSAATPAVLDVRHFGGEQWDEVPFKPPAPPADLVKVVEQVRRVVIHAHCPAALKFVRSITFGEQAQLPQREQESRLARSRMVECHDGPVYPFTFYEIVRLAVAHNALAAGAARVPAPAGSCAISGAK